MAAVPTTLAEITPDWLTATLKDRLRGTAVVDVEVAPLHRIANYNGTLAQVFPKYASPHADAPDSLVAKLIPQNERMLHLGSHLTRPSVQRLWTIQGDGCDGILHRV